MNESEQNEEFENNEEKSLFSQFMEEIDCDDLEELDDYYERLSYLIMENLKQERLVSGPESLQGGLEDRRRSPI